MNPEPRPPPDMRAVKLAGWFSFALLFFAAPRVFGPIIAVLVIFRTANRLTRK